MREPDYLVVGAGLAGGVVARRLADSGKKVKIVERRNHISGNIYDCDYEGVRVQRYGPHVFHTDDVKVYDFISAYTVPVPYRLKCEAVIDGIATPTPFNFKTVEQFYSEERAKEVISRLLEYYGNREYVTVLEMLGCEDSVIRGYAEFLFEKDYKLYTAKQWGINPDEIDHSVLKRVPVALSYADTYFHDRYEFLPEKGFTEFYSNMVDSELIECETGVDAKKHITFTEDKVMYDGRCADMVYTGAIDELFDYRFGVLPYRTLYFDIRKHMEKSIQNAAIVAYPQEDGFTRITEYTKLPFQECGHTIAAVEYPMAYDKNSETDYEPYYPVLTLESRKQYAKYKEYAKRYDNLTLCGRLADFRYYNMDQAVLRAMEVGERLIVKNRQAEYPKGCENYKETLVKKGHPSG